ncbi:MAG: GNAT family protein [Gemmatimonadales bacterium]|nr:GNAT family protein [Gemmatimonadales bacterium]
MDQIALSATATLRPLVGADAPDLHGLITANRAHLDRWLRWSSGIRTPADAAAFIAIFEEKQRAGDGFHLGLRVDGALAGGCICWYIHRQNRNAEVGYWLDAGRTGQGLATRMAAAVVGHLFRVERLHRIEMLCAVENTASRAIPERLGFRVEGVKRHSHWITTRFLDHAVYGLLEDEWRAGGP